MAEHLGHDVDLTEQLFIDGEERDFGIGWLATQTGIPKRKLRRHFYEGEPLNNHNKEAIERAISIITEDSEEEEMLSEIEEGDAQTVNGGYYVEPDKRDVAEKLVEQGKVVRLTNPAGVSPLYVPMDSDHYSRERLERLRERQT